MVAGGKKNFIVYKLELLMHIKNILQADHLIIKDYFIVIITLHESARRVCDPFLVSLQFFL